MTGEQQQLSPPTYHISPDPNLKPKGTKGSHHKSGSKAANSMPATDGAADAAANKPKRVRTGCLTCRERHLKCDEGLPDWYVCR